MSDQRAPVCRRHESEVEMSLKSLHSDSTRPGLVGLYECPRCGDERRVPVETAA